MSRYNFAYDILFQFIKNVFPLCFSRSNHTEMIVDILLRSFPARIACYEMAAMLCISNRRLQKICASSFHITFTRLKRILRVYYALKLFAENKLDNNEVAEVLYYSERTNLMRDIRIELNVCTCEVRRLLDSFSPQYLFDKLWKR